MSGKNQSSYILFYHDNQLSEVQKYLAMGILTAE